MDQIISCTKQHIKEADGLTPEVERQLSILGDIEKNLQTICRTIRKEEDDLRKTLERLRKNVAHGDYIIVRCKTVALSLAVRKMEQEGSKLPGRIQPKVREINSYFESIEKQTVKIDTWMDKIATKASAWYCYDNVGKRNHVGRAIDR